VGVWDGMCGVWGGCVGCGVERGGVGMGGMRRGDAIRVGVRGCKVEEGGSI